jgi:hypothetical protein
MREGAFRTPFRPVVSFLLLACASMSVGAAPKAHSVTAQTTPPMTIEVDTAFRALRAITFPIEDMTVATRHVFVQTGDDGLARRIAIIQFEAVNPRSDFRFQFPSTPPESFGPDTYRYSSFVFDAERAAREQPDREPGQTGALFEANDIVAPRLWKGARLARVSDAEGMSEIILFYFESADDDPPPRLDADGYAAVSEAEAARLLAALRATMRPVGP